MTWGEMVAQTGELFDDRLGGEVEWFLQNARLAGKVKDARMLVHRLLAISEERGIPYRSVVLALSQWIDDNPRRAPRKRVGQFYASAFARYILPAATKSKAPPPMMILSSLVDWTRGVDGHKASERT